MTDYPQNRLRVLDGLRALAITLVLLRHSVKAFWVDLATTHCPLFVPFLMNGWCGVTLFFVLSGFLITRQLLSGDTALYFYKKRFFRIAPAYYLILTLACLGLFPAFPLRDAGHAWRWRYFYHVLFLQDIFPSDIMPVFWSLSVECQFYVVAPLLVRVLLRADWKRRYLVLALGAAFAVLINIWAALHYFPHSVDYNTWVGIAPRSLPFKMEGFMAGLIGAFLFADEDARRKLGRLPIANALFWSGAILFVALTGFVIQLEGDIGFFAIGLLTPLLSVAFAFMMLGLLGGCTGHNIFAVRPLRFIALISYSLYLIHTALILPCIEAVFRIIPESHPLLAWAVFLIPFLFLSVALSTVSYFAVEKPFIDWSKRSVPAGW